MFKHTKNLQDGMACPLTRLFAQIYEVSAQVFDSTAPLMPGAVHVLHTLAQLYPLALLTKGDERVQQQRIRASDLSPYFQLIEIVPEKTSSDFQRVIGEMGGQNASSWSIGNSLRSDIIPALGVDMNAVWITHMCGS